jgi:hypothetical protein
MSKIYPFEKTIVNPESSEDVPEDVRLSLFGENNQDIEYFNSVDQEVIELGGSDMYYIKFMRSENFDELYEEDRDKVYANKLIIRGHYTPAPIGQEITQFGITLSNDQRFVFNKDYLKKKLGRLPIAGDIIQPRFQNIYFQIHQVDEEAFNIWGVYHLSLHAKLLKDVGSVIRELRVEV